MHRNTVRNILNQFNTLDTVTQTKVLTNTLSHEDLLKFLAPIKGKPPKPGPHPKQATLEQEKLIVKIHSEVSMGPRRMRTYIQRAFGIQGNNHKKVTKLQKSLTNLTIYQIYGIYKRNNLKSKKVRTKSGERRALYDYKKLETFAYMHYDVKQLTDQHALPEEIYKRFKLNPNIPIYMWNIIEVKSRFRFIAYSHNLASEFGRNFLHLTIQYIRGVLANWDTHITVGTDNGTEFYSGSQEKEQKWNDTLKYLNAHIYSYEPGFDIRKNLIERSHLTDDTEFLIPRGRYIHNKESFLKEARDYVYYFNTQRVHTGIGMEGRTPLEVLQDSGLCSAHRLVQFPTMILEDNFALLSDSYSILELNKLIEEYVEEHPDQDYIDAKTTRDWQNSVKYFSGNAQKVFRLYPQRIQYY
jgi:hypothetical protein